MSTFKISFKDADAFKKALKILEKEGVEFVPPKPTKKRARSKEEQILIEQLNINRDEMLLKHFNDD